MMVFFLVIYFYGGPVYASCKCSQAGKSTLPYYFIGIGTLLTYLPLYWYRKRVEDKRGVTETTGPGAVPASTASTGGQT